MNVYMYIYINNTKQSKLISLWLEKTFCYLDSRGGSRIFKYGGTKDYMRIVHIMSAKHQVPSAESSCRVLDAL